MNKPADIPERTIESGKPVFDPEILARAMLPKIPPSAASRMIVLHKDDGAAIALKIDDIDSFFEDGGKAHVSHRIGGTQAIKETLDVAVATYNRALCSGSRP